MSFLLAIRHALRDMRGSLRHFRLLFICLCLGVTIMTCIGSVIGSLKASVDRDAKAMLGGDIEIRQLYRPLGTEEMAYLQFNAAHISRTMDMRAMAEGKGDNIDKSVLVEIKGVDNQYPLFGEMEFTEIKRKDIFFSNWKGEIHGAAVEQSLLDALHINLGELFKVGEAVFRATALIKREPDRTVSSFSLGPRVMVNMAAFKATKLVTDTSMVNYRYRVELAEGTDASEWKRAMQKTFPGAYWNIRDWRDNTSSIGQQIDKLSLFFVLTAMTTMIIAGIGISNAASAYMWGKRNAIATFKCLGASSWHVHNVYLLQLLIVATIAIAYGVLFGLGISIGVLHLLQDVLPVKSEAGLYPRPMMLSAGLGYLTVLMFGLIPIRKTHNIRPASLLRGYVDESAAKEPLSLSSLLLGPVYLALSGGMLWLAIQFTSTTKIPLYFAFGLIFSLTLLYLISSGIKYLAGKLSHKGPFMLRMALGNLARHGAATASIVIALGIGMSALTALTLVGSNLHEQLERSLPEKAPAYFLLDVLPSKLEPLKAELKKIDGVNEVRSLPLIRGRISKLNGTLSENVVVADQVRWALDGTRGMTFAAKPPENSIITEGTWWPKNYKGKPLVSFDASLARGLGLKVGDTISVAAVDKEITGTIANLREIPWGSLEMNFTTIFSPGSLEDLPITNLMTIKAPPSSGQAIADLLRVDYPGVGLIRVRDALSNVSAFITQMARAIYITAALAVLCGTLVMASAIHATLFKRKFDTVMMKVIGMTRRRIMGIYLLEFTLIALITSLIAGIIGSVSGYAIMQLLIFSHFTFMPDVIAATIAGSISIAVILGFFATRMVLKVRPLALLRNQ